MRTAWRLGCLTIHNYTDCVALNTEMSISVVTGFDAVRNALNFSSAKLLGYFRISGMEDLNEELQQRAVDDTILIAVVERSMGISLHEFATGLNFSEGCYTLSNDITPFTPLLLRAVIKNIDCASFEKRIIAMRKYGVLARKIPTNRCPVEITYDPMFSATCPRCCADWEEKDLRSITKLGECPDCGLQLIFCIA